MLWKWLHCSIYILAKTHSARGFWFNQIKPFCFSIAKTSLIRLSGRWLWWQEFCANIFFKYFGIIHVNCRSWIELWLQFRHKKKQKICRITETVYDFILVNSFWVVRWLATFFFGTYRARRAVREDRSHQSADHIKALASIQLFQPSSSNCSCGNPILF